MFMEFIINGEKFSVKIEDVSAVVFQGDEIGIYLFAHPFIRLSEKDSKEMFMEWYDAQDKFKRHPVDVKPLEAKKTGKQKQEKENDKTD